MLAISTQAQKVTFGPMVSGMYNWAEFKKSDWDYRAIGGYSAGLFFRAKLLKFYFEPELLYSSRGSDFQQKDQTTGQYNLQNFRYKTIDVNAMFGFQLFAFGHDAIGFRLHTGPGMFFMIDDAFKLNDTALDPADFKKNVVNWQFGFGLDVTHRLQFDARYELGLSSLHKDESIIPKAFMIQVGYKLIHKK